MPLLGILLKLVCLHQLVTTRKCACTFLSILLRYPDIDRLVDGPSQPPLRADSTQRSIQIRDRMGRLRL